jgi:HSP20 family molecular chaperone IbpA
MLIPIHTFLPYDFNPALIRRTKTAVKQHPYNLVDNSKEFRVSIDVPGSKESDLAVTVDDSIIKVVVNRESSANKTNYQYTFLVDPKSTDLDSAQASLDNGILIVTALKKPQQEPIVLSISSDDDEVTQAADSLTAENMFATTMDVPGIAKSDLQVKLDKNVVHVEGIRRIVNTSGKNCNKKIRYSDVFPIDPDKVEIEKIKVVLSNGLLTIFAPKKTKPDPVSIPIQTGAEISKTIDDNNFEKIILDVPGVKHTDIVVSIVEGRLLSIKASRQSPSARTYTKTVHLDRDEIEINNIEAILNDGQLLLFMPRKIKKQPRNIEISVIRHGTTNDAVTNSTESSQ